MSQVRISFVIETDETEQDAQALDASKQLMEWLVEAGPTHVANFADIDVLA